jgi:SAM-dependent methyltransferase
MLKKINNNDAWEKIWNRNFFAKEFPDKEVVDFINYHLPKKNKRKKRVLDIGFGNGVNLKYFHGKGFRCYGIEIIKKNISLIKKDFNNRIKVKLGDFKSLDFAKNYFDFVTCNGVLYYDSKINVAKGVKEIYRVMKSKGICRIYLLSSNDYNFKIKNYFEKSYKIPLKRTFFNYKEIKKIFFPFKKVLIGKHDFNFIDYKKKHSYWVITAYK